MVLVSRWEQAFFTFFTYCARSRQFLHAVLSFGLPVVFLKNVLLMVPVRAFLCGLGRSEVGCPPTSGSCLGGAEDPPCTSDDVFFGRVSLGRLI